jgi:hypothetical protein
MLEYFTYKKFKKNKKEREERERDGKDSHASSSSSKDKKKDEQPVGAESRRTKSPTPSVAPVLDQDDESFLESLLSDDAPPPALPPRIKTPEVSWESDDSRMSAEHSFKRKEKDGKVKDKEQKRFSLHFLTSILDKDKSKDHKALTLAPPKDSSKAATSEVNVDREERDITRVLNNLNLSARNDRAFSLTSESTELARRFNLVLRDLVRGVPTAANDLQKLVEDRDGVIERTYEKLPSSMKKLVEKMPEKLTASLAPELLAAAAESQGKKVEKGSGLGDAAKNFLTPKNLTELVTKPGAVVGMLRAIVNALKLRWPAFLGTNIIWSVAVFCKSSSPLHRPSFPSSVVFYDHTC